MLGALGYTPIMFLPSAIVQVMKTAPSTPIGFFLNQVYINLARAPGGVLTVNGAPPPPLPMPIDVSNLVRNHKTHTAYEEKGLVE